MRDKARRKIKKKAKKKQGEYVTEDILYKDHKGRNIYTLGWQK